MGQQEQPPPPDPRLAIPGYQSGTVDIKLGGDAKTWKQRLRTAPYAVPPYAWDPATSAGSGPTTSVAVFGFDPFTPESQIRALFASYGHIAELDNKTDLNTGTFLGVCSIRYKDSRPTRGQPVLAVDAAKRAESEGNGQRLGMNTIRVEKDRGGRRGKRIVESMTRRNEQRREKEKRTMTAPPSATVAMSSPSGLGPAPPPNAPKGPSGKPAGKPPEAPRAMLPQKSHAPSLLIETEPVLSRIKRMPYCFISHVSVPVLGTTIPHLKRRMKNYDWHEIAVDLSGYFIIFEDSKRGEDEALKCFQGTNNQAMFTYNMVVECQQYGNPNYERSPSPERALAEKREKDESERVRRNDEQDIEEEKKQRALNLDPVLAALEQVRVELRDKIMTDVKTRIAAPALYDFLDPTRHTAKRRKLNIADPTEHSRQPTFLNFIDEKDSNSVSGTLKKPLPFSSSISRLRKEFSRPSGNAFMDERRQRPVKRRTEVRSLHQRLPDYYAEDESEDEHSGPQTYDTESRQLSRHSSVTAGFDQDDYVYKGQHPLGRDETPLDAESGDDGIVTAKSLLEPGLLKKEPEDMAVEELQLLINSLPLTHRLHKRAKIEMLIRRKTRDDDQLFHIKTEDIEETQLVEDAGVIPAETISDMLVESAEFVLESKASKKSKAKKKSKKQIFEEREAAKAEEVSLETLLAATDAEEPTQDVPMLNDVEAETAEEQEMEERAEVEWGVSMEAPRRTVEDDPGIVLDVDGWQHLIKDDEDLQFLKEALEDQSAADLGDVDSWVSRQKNIKALNNGGNYGIVKVAPQIQGYYNPHISGCARTEGMKKIVESEKSKYLPHRIKVAQARARREAAAESDPVIDAEAVRQAKLVSNATSRSTRANNRTHIKDINTVKQVLALGIDGAQSDAIRFNQLKKRKKLVKFDRSAIHGWGLYAEENIALGDMIIEYVGEKVRQAVANIRELRYDKQGMGSSYLFRIDEDSVVDATKKGGIARFINHSCAPNCTAKIIRVDGTKRIVIYALREIAKSKSFAEI